jgi:hypothetical protein
MTSKTSSNINQITEIETTDSEWKSLYSKRHAKNSSAIFLLFPFSYLLLTPFMDVFHTLFRIP